MSEIKNQPIADDKVGDIQALAFVLWERRGSPVETPDVDWMEAEHLVIMSRSEKPQS